MVGTAIDEINRIKEYAKNENIPIIQDEGIEFIIEFIINHKIKSVLEIGTAIGYSAIRMALSVPDLKIISVERDEKRYLEALKNVKRLKLEDRITLIFKDALEAVIDDKVDLVFIDAAKSQSIGFFEKYEKNLNEDGYIITDNMYFHGYVFKEEEEIKSKNLRALVRKIKDYHKYLKENKKFNTTFYELGDGISVSSQRKNEEKL